MKILFLTSHNFGMYAYTQLEEYLGKESFWCWLAEDKPVPEYPDEYTLGISFLYNYRIPADQLTPNHCWLNFHPAPLPNYRGRNVAYHALMKGETEFGATLHYVDATFDTGDIIKVKRFPIEVDDNAGDVAMNARIACLELFEEYIPRFLKGERPRGKKQEGGTYYPKTMIDNYIQLTSEQEKQVRAVTAHPHHAYTVINGRTYNLIPK